MSAFSALKSACTASVPGMGSRLSWCVISPHRTMFLQEVELVEACVCPEGCRSGFEARYILTGWQISDCYLPTGDYVCTVLAELTVFYLLESGTASGFRGSAGLSMHYLRHYRAWCACHRRYSCGAVRGGKTGPMLLCRMHCTWKNHGVCTTTLFIMTLVFLRERERRIYFRQCRRV